MFAYLLWEQNVVKKDMFGQKTEKFLKRFNFFLILMKAKKKLTCAIKISNPVVEGMNVLVTGNLKQKY